MASKLLACICSSGRQEQRRLHREIEKKLKQEKRESDRSFKVLLLGTGGSGKSTLIKQMRIIHGNGYTTQERNYFKQLIFQNMMSALQILINSMDTLSIAFSSAEAENAASRLFTFNPDTVVEISAMQLKMALQLWNDAKVQDTFHKRLELQLQVPDVVQYYLDNLGRLFTANYMPTLQDILRVRVPTTGITEYPFRLDGLVFRLVDVGGQRSERRKWIHCFEECTSIIFVTACSEYDEVTMDVDTQGQEVSGNRMAESLALFQTIMSYPWFENSSIILFLNKKDLLKLKVSKVNFAEHFPSYEGPASDYHSIRLHIRDMFSSLNPDPARSIYSHFTCATDTENIRFVFDAVKETIILQNLRRYRLM